MGQFAPKRKSKTATPNPWQPTSGCSKNFRRKKVDPDIVKIHSTSHTEIMPISIDQIVEETREMPPETVAELIDRIMVARHGGIEQSVDQSWKKEIDRRIQEMETGKVKGVSLEESLARARKAAGL
jgi:putative addiction module component (TIGR02574 family)